METTDWVLITTIIVVLSGLFTGLWGILGRYLADRRVAILERDMESVIMTLRSRAGEEGRARSQAEEAAFMAQAAEILKGEGDMPQKIQKVVALNPAMAFRLAKKLGVKI